MLKKSGFELVFTPVPYVTLVTSKMKEISLSKQISI